MFPEQLDVSSAQYIDQPQNCGHAPAVKPDCHRDVPAEVPYSRPLLRSMIKGLHKNTVLSEVAPDDAL